MVNNGLIPDDDAAAKYAHAVGLRLRAVRRQKRLSLQAVEKQSAEEFKASVLGAYERGERTILGAASPAAGADLRRAGRPVASR